MADNRANASGSKSIEGIHRIDTNSSQSNYIDPKTGECLLPLDFDSVTAINGDGDFQVEYNGKLYEFGAVKLSFE